jgi:hypothetical protein
MSKLRMIDGETSAVNACILWAFKTIGQRFANDTASLFGQIKKKQNKTSF